MGRDKRGSSNLPDRADDGRRGLRVSTAQRDGVVARLQTASAEGRIDERELDERVADALAATGSSTGAAPGSTVRTLPSRSK